METRFKPAAALGLLLAGALLLPGCAAVLTQDEALALQTETGLRARWGEPGRVWPAAADAAPSGKVLEYSGQPSGHTAYMVDIGPDGKVTAIRQVLNRQSFARVVVGMAPEDVLRLLGRPMQITPYSLSGLTYYEWRYLDGPTRENSAVFFAVFDPSMRLVSTGSVRDPDLDLRPDPRIGKFGHSGYSGYGDHFGHSGHIDRFGHSGPSGPSGQVPRLHRGNPATMGRFSH